MAGVPRDFGSLTHRLFLLSYVSLRRHLDARPTPSRWGTLKSAYDSKLNRIVFSYIARNRLDGDGKDIFDAVYYVFSRHLRNRVRLFRLVSRLPLARASAFVVLAAVDARIAGAMHLTRDFAAWRSQFRLRAEELPQRIHLSLNFPEHAFNAATLGTSIEAPPQGVWFSFGDYLRKQSATDPTPNVSVNEYVRPSRKAERARGESSEPSDGSTRRYATLSTTTVRADSDFLWYLLDQGWRVLAVMLTGVHLYRLERLRADVRAGRYLKLFETIEATGRKIGTIFVLPFDDLGSLRTNRKWRHSLLNVNYSHNVIIPPAGRPPSLLMDRTSHAAGIFSLNGFVLNGRAVGFTEIYRQVEAARRALLERYGATIEAASPEQPAQHPMLLGFEREQLPSRDTDDRRRVVAVFDVPPETFDASLTRALCGDMSCEFSVIEAFLLQIAEACAKADACMMFKPKYSLSNYAESYRELINRLLTQYTGRVFVVDPYSNLDVFLTEADVCISFPYTSTRVVSAALGKASAYFLPSIASDLGMPNGDKNYAVINDPIALTRFISAS